MKITKFDVQTGEHEDDFIKNRRTVLINYRLGRQRVDRVYVHRFPLEIIDDIGPAELARRVYSVFKQHIRSWNR